MKIRHADILGNHRTTNFYYGRTTIGDLDAYGEGGECKYDHGSKTIRANKKKN
jgi:hypothetical protein